MTVLIGILDEEEGLPMRISVSYARGHGPDPAHLPLWGSHDGLEAMRLVCAAYQAAQKGRSGWGPLGDKLCNRAAPIDEVQVAKELTRPAAS